MNILDQRGKIVLFLILILGFSLRFYGAKILPLNQDDIGSFSVAKSISFDPHDLKLPLIDKDPEDAGLVFHRYLIKIGEDLFGESNLGGRLPFVIFGVLTILMLYFLVRPALGTGVALLACFLLSMDQFHIGISRVSDYNGVHLFFVTLSLYLFYKALKEDQWYCHLINGLVIGVGFWVKETMLLLIPTYIFYLMIVSEYRFWLKRRIFWLSFLISGLIMLPEVYAILSAPGAPRYFYIATNAKLGLSLNATSLYLGELLLLMIKPNHEFFRQVFYDLGAQLPMENFVLGSLTLCSVVFFLKEKNRFLKLMILSFVINFIVFSFIRQYVALDNIWAMSSFSWSCLGFIPGLIITSYFLVFLIKKYAWPASIVVILLLAYIFIRSVDIATYPIAAYFPARDHCIDEVQEWLDSIGFLDGQGTQPINDVKLLKSIYLATSDRPAYKRMAAIRLAAILEEQGKIKESRPYLAYLNSQADAR